MNAGVEYQLLEHNIHDFVWRRNDRAAVDEYIAHLARIYDTAPAQQTIFWLVRDGGTGIPPIRYFLQQVSALEKRYPQRPPTRAAVLYGTGIRLTLLNALMTMTNLYGRDHTRFFTLDQYDAAVTWLIEQQQVMSVR
ncbi:MAG: hypothetical protein MUE40_15550 [Anaerolineae bacterium]|jgi:hypothetical protein|nr:hypothetical protein [Anaerolineae bacterium]